MPITSSEARERILAKVAELKRLSDEFSAILEDLPIPSLEEFEDLRRGVSPWTAEAHIAALIRNADFLVDEAATMIEDYSSATERNLRALWKRRERQPAPLERSLRYLVQDRSGTAIPPSEEEELYYDPAARGKATLGLILEGVIDVCGQLRVRLSGKEGRPTK